METKSIKDLKKYHKNPRKITKDKFELLEQKLDEFGDLSGIILNIEDGEVIGGNQRTAIFQRSKDAKIILIDKFEVPTKRGTVAWGFVELDGERYSYREVKWDKNTAEKANIVANKVGATWDFDVLANEFEISDLLESGFEDFELSFAGSNEVETDTNELSDHLESYLDANIKQITLYYPNDDYADRLARIEKIMEDNELKDTSEVFDFILKFYEDNNS